MKSVWLSNPSFFFFWRLRYIFVKARTVAETLAPRDIMVEHLHGKKHKRRLACLSEPVRNAFLKKLRNLGLFKGKLGYNNIF